MSINITSNQNKINSLLCRMSRHEQMRFSKMRDYLRNCARPYATESLIHDYLHDYRDVPLTDFQQEYIKLILDICDDLHIERKRTPVPRKQIYKVSHRNYKKFPWYLEYTDIEYYDCHLRLMRDAQTEGYIIS